MPLLFADDVHLAYGARTIFDGASLAVEHGDRLGIVGANGSGKSTLLEILAGQLEPDGGRIVKTKGLRVGYLAQEHGDVGDGSLLDVVLARAPGRDTFAERAKEVEAELAEEADPDVQMLLATELSELLERLDHLDRDYAPHRAKRILVGLGFLQSDFDRSVTELSGGWRMRAALAGLLFERPDVMLLDEPTNHLDVPSVHWLSRFIGSVRQAIVLTCHDKEFLNKHVRRVASLELEGLRAFRGNYDDYLEQRELDLEHLERRIENQEQKKRELEAFVNRFRAKATKARQAQSRVKQIEKLEAERVELPKLRRPMSIHFPPTDRSGGDVVRVNGLSFGYGEAPLFEGIDLLVRARERVAIVGANGAGKTTLLKLVAGELKPDGGKIELGTAVKPSYFAQHHAETLDDGATVLESVWAMAPELSQTEARGMCGAFLFSGDDVEKKVGVLSGGERARVALARMLVRPGNLLLLDEPTNHLDTESADKLTESLLTYDGTLLFVSHNLDFARRLSNVVWDVDRGVVETYPGSLADYLEHLAEQEDKVDAELGTQDATTSVPTDKAARVAAREKKKAEEKEKRKKRAALERSIAEAEKAIADLESKKSDLETQLADPATLDDHEKLAKLGTALSKVETELEGWMDRWAELEEAHEAGSSSSSK